MPVIKVWCLPEQTEEELRRLHQGIVSAVVGVSELGLEDENDMTVFFPPDMMKYGIGSEVVVEVSGLFSKPERTPEVRNRLAEGVGRCVHALYPNAKVECFVTVFEPWQGFWTSEQ